jgi:hypothetical protein
MSCTNNINDQGYSFLHPRMRRGECNEPPSRGGFDKSEVEEYAKQSYPDYCSMFGTCTPLKDQLCEKIEQGTKTTVTFRDYLNTLSNEKLKEEGTAANIQAGSQLTRCEVIDKILLFVADKADPIKKLIRLPTEIQAAQAGAQPAAQNPAAQPAAQNPAALPAAGRAEFNFTDYRSPSRYKFGMEACSEVNIPSDYNNMTNEKYFYERRRKVLEKLTQKELNQIAHKEKICTVDAQGYNMGRFTLIDAIIDAEKKAIGADGAKRSCNNIYANLSSKRLDKMLDDRGYGYSKPKTIDKKKRYLCETDPQKKCDLNTKKCDDGQVCDVTNWTRDTPYGVCISKNSNLRGDLSTCEINGTTVVGPKRSIEALRRCFQKPAANPPAANPPANLAGQLAALAAQNPGGPPAAPNPAPPAGPPAGLGFDFSM